MANFLTRLFGTKNSRELARMQKIVEQVNNQEANFDSNTDLIQFTADLRSRRDAGQSLDQLLPEAFAAVREAAKRTKGMRHFDV